MYHCYLFKSFVKHTHCTVEWCVFWTGEIVFANQSHKSLTKMLSRIELEHVRAQWHVRNAEFLSPSFSARRADPPPYLEQRLRENRHNKQWFNVLKALPGHSTQLEHAMQIVYGLQVELQKARATITELEKKHTWTPKKYKFGYQTASLCEMSRAKRQRTE